MKKLLIASVSVLALSAGAAFAQSNNSTVEQIGSSNIAGVDQGLNGGSSNSSTVYQGANYGSSSSQAYVSQAGGTGSIIGSTVVQDNTGQYASVNQNASGTNGSTAGGTQSSFVQQSNNANSASVIQTSAGGSQGSTVYQSGQYGAVAVNQSGVSDSSYVNQTGYGSNGNNVANGGVSVTQSGLSNNSSTVNQYSDYSAAVVNQSGNAGYSNQSTVTQSGSSDTAIVWQQALTGNNNSGVTQAGSSNYASVHQH